MLVRLQRHHPHPPHVDSVEQEQLVVQRLCPPRPHDDVDIADHQPRHRPQVRQAPGAHGVRQPEQPIADHLHVRLGFDRRAVKLIPEPAELHLDRRSGARRVGLRRRFRIPHEPEARFRLVGGQQRPQQVRAASRRAAARVVRHLGHDHRQLGRRQRLADRFVRAREGLPEVLQRLQDQRGHVLGRFPRQVRIAVRRHQHGRTDHGDVRMRKAVREVAVQDSWLLLPFEATLVDHLRRPHERGRRRNDQRQPDQVPHGMHLTPHDPDRRLQRLHAHLVAVDVRVLVAVEHRVGCAQHGFGRIPVQVQRHHHGNLVPNQCPQVGQERPFHVVHAIGRAGAVQRQHDRVQFTRRLDLREHRVADRLVRRAGNRRRRLGGGRECRNQLHAQPLARRDHPAEVVLHAPVMFDHLITGVPVARLERLYLGEARTEGVRFVRKLANRNSHRALPQASKRPAPHRNRSPIFAQESRAANE